MAGVYQRLPERPAPRPMPAQFVGVVPNGSIVQVRDLRSGEAAWSAIGHPYAPWMNTIRFSPDSRRAVAGLLKRGITTIVCPTRHQAAAR